MMLLYFLDALYSKKLEFACQTIFRGHFQAISSAALNNTALPDCV